jgi:hypothetical protein
LKIGRDETVRVKTLWVMGERRARVNAGHRWDRTGLDPNGYDPHGSEQVGQGAATPCNVALKCSHVAPSCTQCSIVSMEWIKQVLIIPNNHCILMLNVLLYYLFKYNELVTYFIMINNINYL